ncbi:MAG TPA: PHP domain-containing protein [Syntrophomonadaceae bacterium]|nr:PHP domain-containing protein [Syntrophomonadaceae bacterium]
MLTITADLHIHTALSPCAEKEMTPQAVLAQAAANGLQMIAITDHNTAMNTVSFCEAAAGGTIFVVPGMEVQTREEVHMVCLFSTPQEALAWQEYIYKHLPPAKNNERVFGVQQILNKKGEVVGIEDRLLLTSTDLSIEEVVNEMNTRHGICYPAHVDRPAFSIIGSLGFIPHDLAIPAVEISRNINRERAVAKFPFIDRYPLLGSSDAHRLAEISQPRTRIYMEELSFAALIEAFKNRRIEVD